MDKYKRNEVFQNRKTKAEAVKPCARACDGFSLCACGAETTVDSNDSSNNGDVSEVTDDSSSSSVSLEKNETTFESLTIVDDENITVKVESFDSDEQSFNLYLENKTTDKTLMFSVDDVGVNGFACDPYWAKSVSAGKSAYSYLSWYDSTLETNNIESIETVTMTLSASDDDDWSADDVINASVELSTK